MKIASQLFAIKMFSAEFFRVQKVLARGNNTGKHDVKVEFDGGALLDVVSPNADQNISLQGNWSTFEAGNDLYPNNCYLYHQ